MWVSTISHEDIEPYYLAVTASADRLRPFSVVDPLALEYQLPLQSRNHRTFLIHARQPLTGYNIVGKVNVTNVIRGRGQSATIGYDAFDPYAGTGLFVEGLRLVVDLAFTPDPRGLGLRRLEANVQPTNTRSAGVVASLGFVKEGFSRKYIFLPDEAGEERWRDHDRYAVRADQWPAPAYPGAAQPRIVCIVNGLPGSGKTTLARALSTQLGLPLLSKDVLKEAVADLMGPAVYNTGPGSALGAGASAALWRLLADSPVGGIVESWFGPDTRGYVRDGLAAAGVPAEVVTEVWCDVPLAVARQRYEARALRGERHVVHGPQVGQQDMWALLAAEQEPLALGPVLRVDTTSPMGAREAAALGLQVRANAWRASVP